MNVCTIKNDAKKNSRSIFERCDHKIRYCERRIFSVYGKNWPKTVYVEGREFWCDHQISGDHTARESGLLRHFLSVCSLVARRVQPSFPLMNEARL